MMKVAEKCGEVHGRVKYLLDECLCFVNIFSKRIWKSFRDSSCRAHIWREKEIRFYSSRQRAKTIDIKNDHLIIQRLTHPLSTLYKLISFSFVFSFNYHLINGINCFYVCGMTVLFQPWQSFHLHRKNSLYWWDSSFFLFFRLFVNAMNYC